MRPKTIILDIDGTLLRHAGNMSRILESGTFELPGARKKLNEWDAKGYNIILMTGRRESAREFTEKQLTEAGFFWDQLIMGVGGGQRVLINDLKDDPEFGDTAVAIQVERNKGIEEVDI
jgi:phosphoglycolate phosphatase-like HAD superfamily hydrolase